MSYLKQRANITPNGSLGTRFAFDCYSLEVNRQSLSSRFTFDDCLK